MQLLMFSQSAEDATHTKAPTPKNQNDTSPRPYGEPSEGAARNGHAT